MGIEEAQGIAANWRSSHAYPLQALCTTLRSRAKKIDPEALIVQRLKRMPSVITRLKRFDRMQLSQMHDLGGCRAIVNSIDAAQRLVAMYEAVPCSGAVFHRKYDYIANPKADGYRGVHLVYEYRSDYQDRAKYAGQRIEVQIRSRLQHVWATAVETVDTFSDQALKSGIGHESWKRFFALMGSYIALLESGPYRGGEQQWTEHATITRLPSVPGMTCPLQSARN